MRGRLTWQAVVATLLVGCGLFLAGYAGYSAGTPPGVDLDEVREAGAAAGREEGLAEGGEQGYREAYKSARQRSYAAEYAAAYREAYEAEFESAGLEPPQRITVAVRR